MIVQKSTVDEEGYSCDNCCDAHVEVWIIITGASSLYLCENCKEELVEKLSR